MAQADVIIDYKSIIEGISSQIQMVWEDLNASADPSVQEEIKMIKKIEISDEQNYLRKQNAIKEQGNVYIVVKFGAGSINFGSSVCPISLLCMGTANKIKPVQLLMSVFASYWTTKNILQDTQYASNYTNMIQVWNTPEVMSNFNETNIEYRSLLRVSGNIVIGPAAVRVGTLTYIYGDGDTLVEGTNCQTINIMSFQDGYHASLDTQPFGNTDGFTKSEVSFSSYTFSISTYLLEGKFTKDLLAIRGFRYRPNGGYNDTSSIFSPNMTMKLKIQFTNGYNNYAPSGEQEDPSLDPVIGKSFYSEFKVVDSRIGQEIAGIPMLTVAFTH